MGNKPSAETLAIVRNYAIEEPSFTCTFAAWDLAQRGDISVTSMTIAGAVAVLLAEGVIELIEDHGKNGKVYAHVEPPAHASTGRYVSSSLPELDAHRYAILEDLVPERGDPIAGTGRPHLKTPVGKGLKARRNIANNRRRRAA